MEIPAKFVFQVFLDIFQCQVELHRVSEHFQVMRDELHQHCLAANDAHVPSGYVLISQGHMNASRLELVIWVPNLLNPARCNTVGAIACWIQ